ncbi:hypothetical protein C0992_011826 [Termitomyces sp. T32_za158]|nr:hypothetical protein C0992_011826 [Termitomyces sp. T32_za158]
MVMVLAGALSASVRSGSLRLMGRRFAPRIACVGETRSFSLLIQRPARSRTHRIPLLALTSRNISGDAAKTQAVSSTTPADSVATEIPSESVVTDSTVDLLSDATDAIATHLPAALQFGDLAALGLISWTPAGLMRWTFEVINVASGLPWFWTIVAGSLFWRAVLFPISVRSLQNSSRLLPIQPKIKKLQEEMLVVRQSGDKIAMQRTAIKIRKTYKDAGVSMLSTALVPFVQIPITLGMFFGVKKMCELPLEQLTHSGFSLLPDLTVADPYMVLPILLCAVVNAQIQVGAAEMDLISRPEMGHVMNGLRLLSVVGVFVMASFPSGLMVSLITTSVATTLQSWALQKPEIRASLNIPQVPVEARGKLPTPMDTANYVIAKWRAKLAEAKEAQRRG